MGQSKTVATAIVAWALMQSSVVLAENDGAFYVELVGPDEVVDTRKPRGQQVSSPNKTYGPTRASDTLWAIASLNRPSQSVSVYQMMYAMLELNPDAFRNRNINYLLNGQTLRLPSLQQASVLSHRQAVTALQNDGQIPGGKKSTPSVKAKPAEPAPKEAVQVQEPAKVVASPTQSESPSAESKPVEAPVSTPEPAKPVEPLPSQLPEQAGISQKNLDELREKLEVRIDELEKLRRQEFDVLKQQMDESSQQLIGIAEVNHRMKIRVQELSDELAAMRDALGQTQQQQDAINARLDSGTMMPSSDQSTKMGNGFFDSLTNLALVIALPVLLLVLLVVWFLRRRKNNDDEDDENLDENMSLEDETDEYSRLFTEDLEPEADADDINAAFQNDVEDLVEPEAQDDSALFEDEEDLDSIEPEDESSFAELELGESDELGEASLDLELDIDESELEALNSIDAFDSEDLVPGDIAQEPEVVEPATGNAELNDFGLDIDDDSESLAESIEPIEQASDELSFEAAVEQQKEMEAEMASVSQDDINDLLADIDLDGDVSLNDDDGLQEPSSGFDDLEDLIGETPAVESVEALDLSADAKETAAEEDDFSIDFESALDEPETSFESDTDSDLSSLDDLFDMEPDEASEPESAFDSNEFDELNVEEPQSIDSILEEMQDVEKDASSSEDDIDAMFDNLGDSAFAEPSESAEELPAREDLSEREFVDIDTLLNDAEQASEADEPDFTEQDLDVGLDEFPDILADDSGVEFSEADAELSSKLDLARAYLEIDDKDGARKIIEEVMAADSGELAEEAKKLLARLG